MGDGKGGGGGCRDEEGEDEDQTRQDRQTELTPGKESVISSLRIIIFRLSYKLKLGFLRGGN